MKTQKQKSFKRNLFEWGIIISIIAVLYYTGLYSVVISRVQQVILLTGIFQPEINIPVDKQQPADFNLSLISTNNNFVNLGHYKGKIIFLNFWASWCPPCRAEMPTIQKLYDKLKNRKDIDFVLVSLDNNYEKGEKFIHEEGFTFPVYYLNSRLPNIYNTETIPSTFVISKEGKIVAKRIGMADYDTKKFYNFLNSL